jgi:signal transduction histidine kinase
MVTRTHSGGKLAWHGDRRQRFLPCEECTQIRRALAAVLKESEDTMTAPRFALVVATTFAAATFMTGSGTTQARDVDAVRLSSPRSLDEIDNLERITARLLTLLLIDTAAPPTVVDLDETLERVVRRWAPNAIRQWEVDSDVGPTTIQVDRLETALDSLLENAVKFTEHSDVIAVRAWKAAGEIFIEVRDSGRGIPAEELPFIFDHFTSGRSAAAKTGSGLGLPIVRATIAARGGTVTASSTSGEGATFLLRIPEQVPDLRALAAHVKASPWGPVPDEDEQRLRLV